MNKLYTEYAQLFKVLADENRLKIIELLIKGETCGCTLIEKLTISQPTLSYHLKMISDSGIARSEKKGNWKNYYINKDKLSDIISFIENIKNIEVEQCNI